MADDTSRQGLLGNETSNTGPSGNYGALHQNRGQSVTSKLLQLAFICIVSLMVIISFVLSIVRSATVPEAKGLYIMLGLALLGFVALAFFMMYFLRKGDLPADKQWFVYVVGGCIVLESIFTNILLFQG